MYTVRMVELSIPRWLEDDHPEVWQVCDIKDCKTLDEAENAVLRVKQHDCLDAVVFKDGEQITNYEGTYYHYWEDEEDYLKFDGELR